MMTFDVEKITNALGQVVNPASGKTLLSEDRFVELKPSENELFFKYRRDGISPIEKRKIEEDVFKALEEFYSEDQINLATISENSQDVIPPQSQPQSAPTPKANPAQLQAGHGPTGAVKKRVPGAKTVIAVSSGKGGVGKSTVSVNLALSLKQLGKKVGLLDADIYGPSVPMLLNKRDAKPIANDAKKIMPIEACGIHFMSFGLFIDENDPVIWRGPMLGGVLNQFLFDVEWGDLDYLIIDLPPGTGDMQLSLIQATDVDGVVVVSTPQDVALLDSKKGLEMFRKVKVPILGMIENMSYFAPDDSDKKYFIFGEGGVEKAAKQLETEFLGGIPLEIALREGSDKGEPYMNNKNYEGRPVWKSYMEISGKLDKMFNKKGFFSKLFS